MESYTPATLPALSYELASLPSVSSTTVHLRTGRISGQTLSGEDFLVIDATPAEPELYLTFKAYKGGREVRTLTMDGFETMEEILRDFLPAVERVLQAL